MVFVEDSKSRKLVEIRTENQIVNTVFLNGVKRKAELPCGSTSTRSKKENKYSV